MSVNLHKEPVKINEILCSKYEQISAAGDVIVPDINPDVLKVLRITPCVSVTEKSIKDGRAYVKGVIKLNILYVPESKELGKIKAINTSLEFSHVTEAKGIKPSASISAEAECENVSLDLINSRKLSVKCTVGINVKISEATETLIATKAEEDSGLEIKSSNLKLLNTVCDSDKEFSVSERLSLPDGKPPIAEILKIGASAVGTELKPAEGKAAVRGDLKLSVLYNSEETDGEYNIEFFECTLPFTEVFDVIGLKECMECEADYHIKDVWYEISGGESDENTSLNVSLTIGAVIKGTEVCEAEVIEDAYSTEKNIVPTKKAYELERLIDSNYIQLPRKEMLEIPDYLPEIKKVCDITAIPSVTDISISEGTLTVKGIISVNVLYLTPAPDSPISGFDKVIEFTHSFDLSKSCEDSVCEAKVTTEHLSYTLSGARNLELRIISALSVKCMSPEKTEVIDEIEDSDEPLFALPSVIIYFVQPGDTLWNIAKRYHTSWEKIAADNDISGELIKIGQKLLIFR